jgi:hypothetical protein
MKKGEHRTLVTRARTEYPSWKDREERSNRGERRTHNFTRLTVDEDGICYPNEGDYIVSFQLILLSTSPILAWESAAVPINKLTSPKVPSGGEIVRSDVPGSTRYGYALRATWSDVQRNTRLGIKVKRDMKLTP